MRRMTYTFHNYDQAGYLHVTLSLLGNGAQTSAGTPRMVQGGGEIRSVTRLAVAGIPAPQCQQHTRAPQVT